MTYISSVRRAMSFVSTSPTMTAGRMNPSTTVDGRTAVTERGGGVDLGCGGVEALCLEPSGASVSEGNLTFVGPGRGTYEMVQTAQYVGPGGSYDREKVVAYSSWRCRLWCILLFALLILLGVGLLVWQLLPQPQQSRDQDVGNVSSELFDCDAGYWNWQRGWSEAKQKWCCYHKNRGCSSTTSLPFDCEAGYSNWQAGWAPAKKSWCCGHYNRGCVASALYDCNAGFSNWQSGWAARKKAWCCSHKSRGCAQKKSCSLWGDPHIFTFDHSRLVFYSQGDFWVVKSPILKIQGRFQATDWTKKNDKTDYSSMTRIVVGGQIMKDRKIQVGPMDAGNIACDGQVMLHDFGSEKCGDATVTFGDKGELVDGAMAFLPHKVVHIYLPGGVVIQVNRWPNFINAKITMEPMTDQAGICGDFNGVKKQGLRAGKELHAQFGYGVPQHELLFPSSIPLNIPKAMPSDKRCSPQKRKKAEDICQEEVQTSRGWSVAECLGDVCDPHTTGLTSFTAEEMKAHLRG